MELQGRVPVPEADAVRLAREVYGLEARARSLPGEHDDNFHLTASDGRQLVLKVMHPARERSLVELQCAALRHLARTAPDVLLPRVVEGLTGGDVTVAPFSHGGRLVWLLTFVPGTPLAEARPRSLDLLSSVGRLLGRLSAGLAGFTHAGAERELPWDLARAGWIRGHEGAIVDASRRGLVLRVLQEFEGEVRDRLTGLRRSVIHGDANDWNVLVALERAVGHEAVSLIDFGDMHRGLSVAEPAVAAAYALLGQGDPLAAVCALVSGYHEVSPLLEEELAVFWPLVKARLAVSVTLSAERKVGRPDDPYVTISEAPAWDALAALDRIPSRLAHYALRAACGFEPVPGGALRVERLRSSGRGAAKVLDADLGKALVFDLGVGSRFLGADPASAETAPLTAAIFGALEGARASVGVGRYDEARCLYDAALFGGASPTDERRTIHLGMDLFVPAGSVVRTPLEGVVHLVANNAARQDYGPLVILRHSAGDEPAFFTLYGHLSEDTLASLSVGQRLARGDAFARVGAPPANGDWPPHVHFQIVLDLLGLDADYPGVARASERTLWKALSPDPNLLLCLPEERFPPLERGPEPLRAARRDLLGTNLSLSYRRPLQIVRGWRQHLYDETGRAYLDFYNNVPLVGHAHPRVVRAAREQIALLNTNTRYLHENVVRYAERLAALLPESLQVAFFVNSGSEANELALRLARACTGGEDVVVLEHAYHGHTQGTIDVSPYKFEGRGGRGRKDFVHVAPLPDDYRGRYRRDDPRAGPKYAGHVGEIVAQIRGQGRGLAAFLAESLPSVGGQIVFPPGYLAEAYAHVRAAGGVCIADEVQVGFGRLGTHFWGFETQSVVPDIVVLGKPIGNGFPLGAVLTTRAIADAFANGMEFFSTFGGNPVACAVGLAVLDVLAEERLQERARRVGGHFLAGLRALEKRHPLVGDVRGSGLFLGIELVRDRESREPATEEASYVVDRLRERGILTGTDGPHENVLKIRPPLIVSESDVDVFVSTLDDILGEDPVRYGGR